MAEIFIATSESEPKEGLTRDTAELAMRLGHNVTVRTVDPVTLSGVALELADAATPNILLVRAGATIIDLDRMINLGIIAADRDGGGQSLLLHDLPQAHTAYLETGLGGWMSRLKIVYFASEDQALGEVKELLSPLSGSHNA